MRSTLMQLGAHNAAKLHHSSSSPSALSILVHCIFVAGLMLLARTSLLIALPLCSTDLAGQGNAPGRPCCPCRTYVVGKDMVACLVYVARGQSHPALLTRGAQLHSPAWVSGQPPPELAAGEALQCMYQAR